MPHLFIKQWTVLLLLSCFLIVSTISNAAIPAAAPYVARTIVSNPQIRRQAVELLINLGLLGSLTHKNKKTNIKDMNCGINGVVYWGPNITEVEQVFRQNHRYVNVWFSKRDGKYNVYGVDYGEHKDNVTLLAFVWCGGPDIGNYEKGDITIDANKASTELVNQAKKGNVQAKNLVKDALKADNPNLTATQIEQLIKGTATTTLPKPTTQPKPPTTTTPPKPVVPAKPTTPPKPPVATTPPPARPANPPTTSTPTRPANPPAQREPEQPKRCNPCQPYPNGAIGYQGPEVHKTGIDAGKSHYHIFTVNQNQKTCQCFWNYGKKSVWGHQYFGQINPGWINLNSSPKRPPNYPH